MHRWFLPLLIFAFGCSLGRAELATPFPTATTVQSLPTLVPTVGRLASNLATVTATTTSTPAQIAVEPTGILELQCLKTTDLPSHQVTATIDYASQTVQVQQTITYPNRTDESLAALVLNVEPNRWLGVFTLNSLTLDEALTSAAFMLTGRRLDVLLSQPLEPNCIVTLNLNFSLQVPPVIGGMEAFRGYFGQTLRQINLGHWLPTLVPYREGKWLHYESILIGEQIVTESAHWLVNIQVDNAPEGVLVAAPGTMTVLNSNQWQFAHVGREFTASISPVFRRTSAATANGTAVDVYTMPDALIWDEENSDWIDGGAYAAKITAESAGLYAEKFGVAPHERIVIVQGDFPDGMEFSGFAFVSTDWFTRYDGDPAGYLMLITVHEVAHQWWYDLVGNDQANAPWLDESLSTYSEYIYIEQYYPELMDWWWQFRVNRLNPQGFVDSTVYEFDSLRPYINAVYLRGVLMLHDLRMILGDDVFFAWLTDYASVYGLEIATADHLWSLLTPQQQEITAVVRIAFLRQPDLDN